MYPKDESLEALLSETQKDLELVRERVVAIQVSLERCERDDFPHLPPAPMYQRPKFLEKDY